MPPTKTAPERAADTRPAAGGPSGAEAAPPFPERILRVPLFFKLSVANAGIVALASLLSVALAVAVIGDTGLGPMLGVIVFGACLAVLAGVGVNTFLIDLALRPLDDLEEAARTAEDGDLTARAATSPVADSDLRRLIQVFNRMLESVEDSQRRRRELARSLLAAVERERSSLSRELYDDLAQRLAAALVRIPAAERALDGAGRDGSRREPLLAELRGELATALETVREIARRLRPPELDELGVLPALEAEARILSERSGLNITVRSDDGEPDLGPEGRLVLFRILQEALVNAVRHASPSDIEVRIREHEGEVEGLVVDDGRGFEAPPVPAAGESSGPGIRGMEERASYVGGTVEVSSAKGVGTRVSARIPRDPPD